MNKKINAFVNSLKEKKLRLALAESVTCGLAAHKLSTCPGTSDVLAGSIVCYSPEAKKKLLGITQRMIDDFTTESAQVTEALAKGLKKVIGADVYGALTGLASNGGSETKSKPVGTVFLCVIYKNKVFRERKLFRGAPAEIKEKACLALYDLIAKTTNK